MIEVASDARFLNELFNHPEVRPWVADMGEGVLDLTPVVQNHVALTGEYGATCYFRVMEGIWSVHTAILPEGRGEWAKRFAAESVGTMFTASDATEILTRVPQGHIAAKALTLATGFRLQFETPPECKFLGRMVPASIYSLTIQDWWLRSEGTEEQGAQFHAWMNAQLNGQPHENDPAHNKVIGVSLEMLKRGRHRKAVAFFNRWAMAVHHAPITLINEKPVQIRFDAGILTLAEGQLSIEPLH